MLNRIQKFVPILESSLIELELLFRELHSTNKSTYAECRTVYSVTTELLVIDMTILSASC